MSNDTRFAITLLGALTALTALAAPAQPLRAAGTDDVTVTLDRSTALEWRRKLDDARPLSTLEVLGLQDEAELEPVVPVPMRDGIHLSATVILPKSQAGRKLPVILLRSPYRPDAEVSEPLASKLLPHLVRNGYAVVIVNDRGTQWSEGSYQWLKGANQDGSDTLDWIIQQPWSDGKVGTFGCSSSGESQPPLATLNHPAHKAMVEMAGATAAGTLPGYRDQGIFYHGGVPIWRGPGGITATDSRIGRCFRRGPDKRLGNGSPPAFRRSPISAKATSCRSRAICPRRPYFARREFR